MKNSSTISSKGQVTVPQEIRIRLGLSTGDRIEFVVEEGRTILRPARPSGSAFDKYKGALGDFPRGTTEINQWIHEMREDTAFTERADKRSKRR